ncbi:methionine ABC transporter ATP-binding protein [Neobacillus dielmonensis]|uniref:methionine ABC transporter ATP-binding protein n=1 Tax=Neobacillus dielmonensis TaxID=1347369 RepID=UPI0005A99D35|nr:ATP-binding cassette domain-containing protein [Neobacillus dielmonensis]
MIRFEEISKEFKQSGKKMKALNHVSLEIEKGDIFGIIGYSGAGKSTLLRMVNGLETPSEGKVFVKGKELGSLNRQDLSHIKKSINMVFQHFNLLSSKTVFDNVALPLVLNKVDKATIKKRVHELLEFVGLDDKASSYPSQLSGGQKQRVGIARALITDPEILLCDEATSALDPKTTVSILELLKRINQEMNITILIITHEMQVIQYLCNKVAVMEHGQVIETGNVTDVFGNPQNPTTKEFVRTVIHDEIPESIVKELKQSTREKKIFQLKFFGENSSQSLLFQISQKFKAEFNVVFANISELQAATLGIFTIVFYGDPSETEQIRQFVADQGVDIEEVIL